MYASQVLMVKVRLAVAGLTVVGLPPAIHAACSVTGVLAAIKGW
jgi:hypothetical protein